MTTLLSIRFARLGAGLLLATLLAACSSIRTVDAEVASFSGAQAAAKGASYRFEELPSQAKEPLRAEILKMAESALGTAGLRRDDANARYNVEIAMVSEQFLRQPVLLLSRHSRFVLASDPLFWPPFAYSNGLNSAYYRYQLRLVLRETNSARVAYETAAEIEVPWSDSVNMIPALLTAALRDFPQTPSGVRKVEVELGRDGKTP